MTVKLKVPLVLLLLFCLFSALYCFYLYQIKDPLAGIRCASSLRSSHNIQNSNGSSEKVNMVGTMSYAFLGKNQGMLVIDGVISDGKNSYKLKKSFNFSYISKLPLYEFTLQPVKNKNIDTVPPSLINLLFSKIGNHIEINRLDDNNLMIGNMFSPIQVCNIIL